MKSIRQEITGPHFERRKTQMGAFHKQSTNNNGDAIDENPFLVISFLSLQTRQTVLVLNRKAFQKT